MKPNFSAHSLIASVALAMALGIPPAPAGAATTDISSVPLGTASATAVLPNLMFILDDSGSMGWYFMPDNVDALKLPGDFPGSISSTFNCKSYALTSGGTTRNNCIVDSGTVNTISPTTDGVRHVPANDWPAGPPAYAAEYNTIYYNPQITYLPGKDSGGLDLPGFGSPWALVKVNPYVSNNTIDLTAQWPEPVFCNASGADPNSNTNCRRNGYAANGTTLLSSFGYYNSGTEPDNGSVGYPESTDGTGSGAYRYVKMRFGAPHYFTILPREYCADLDLTDCLAAAGTPTAPTAPNGTHTILAPVRYCTTPTLANQTAVVSGGTPASCQAKLDANHIYLRYGTFVRKDIVPSATFIGRPNRGDCAAQPDCTYAEEMTNFANWVAYYHTRIQMMKSTTSRVFSTMDDRYRIGFITINPTCPNDGISGTSCGSSVLGTKYLEIQKFDVAHKALWYQKLGDQLPAHSTPLRTALSRVGRHYAGMSDQINSGMTGDPVQFSCQQNFALLTTDGYWNGTGGVMLNGTTAMDNQDNVVGTFVNRPTGTLDAAGTTVADTGTTRTEEQVVCTGNAAGSANFSGAPDTNCGCSGNFKRVKQRTLDTSTTTTYVDGVAGPPSTNTVSSFQDITACNALQQTVVDRVRETERVVCSGSGTANFSGTPDTACGCTGSNKRIKQRQRDMDRTVVTVDGVPGAPTYGNPGASTFTNVAGSPPSGTAGGSCVSSGTTLTPPAPAYAFLSNISNTTTGSTITSVLLSPNPTVTTLPPSSTTTPGGAANTLADAAMYYYKTDLRPTGAVSKNNVPTTVGVDEASHQHMVTFTLGLGLDGLMNYQSDYPTANSGDFKKIKDGVTGCSFSPGGPSATCNWPQPVQDAPSALDDLWHAAVNGRGTYFSAKNPNTLQSGLTGALQAIKTTTGAAAAAATSNANITPSDNFAYASTYRTVKWDGELVAEKIDIVTGIVLPGIAWSAGSKLDPRALPASDDRAIFTFDPSDASDKLKPFLYGNLSGTEAAFFDNHCTNDPAIWPQCGAMSPGDLAIANSGTNLVNYLRGQKQHETNYYRVREHVLGDTVNAKPVSLGKPDLIYGDAVVPDYNSFKTGPAASRTPAVFIGANDGMLHAFHGGENAVGGGTELWAYAPRMLLPQLFKLAATNYDVNHRYYVDGTPVTMDVFLGGAWKTMLVSGLNAGGRGYFALDVTDTSNPKGMWEICSDASLCAISDPEIGYTYGQPIITKRPSDGKWVVIVTSGYNNVLPGDGGGYLFVLDAATGAVLSKTPTAISGTNVGDTTTPSGFAKVSEFVTNFAVDNTTTFVYGGDLLGNVWRFELSTNAATPDAVTVQRIGQTLDGSTPPKPQSITTRPELTRFDAGFKVIYVATGRFLGASDIPDPATLVPPMNLAYQQTVYGFKDTGADLGNLRAPAAGLVQQVMSVIDANNRTISNNAVDWSTRNGWWVDLNPANDSPGERVYEDMQLVRGALLVSANEPNNEACSSGGNRFFYFFHYRSGSYLPSSPGQVVGIKGGSALSAGFVVYRLPSGPLKMKQTDITGTQTFPPVPPPPGGAIGRRATWRELYQ